jgi:hypothetical protein
MRPRMGWTKGLRVVTASKWDTHHINPWCWRQRLSIKCCTPISHCHGPSHEKTQLPINSLSLGIWPVIRLIAWKEIYLRVYHYYMIFSCATTPYGLCQKMLFVVYLLSSCCKCYQASSASQETTSDLKQKLWRINMTLTELLFLVPQPAFSITSLRWDFVFFCSSEWFIKLCVFWNLLHFKHTTQKIILVFERMAVMYR